MSKFKVGEEVVYQPYKMDRRPKSTIRGIKETSNSVSYYIEHVESKSVIGWFDEKDIMSYYDYIHEED